MKMQRICLVLLTFITVTLIGCLGMGKNNINEITPEQFFLRTLNLTQMPAGITHFQGRGAYATSAIFSKGYFTYTADSVYFEFLLQHYQFREQSNFNEVVQKVACDHPKMKTDFTYWTQEQISLSNKQCLTGIFFPYAHYIVYDPRTMQVWHFITEIRE